MDGRRHTDGCMGGGDRHRWTDEQRDGWADGDKQMVGWTKGRTETDRRIDGWTDGNRQKERHFYGANFINNEIK